MKRHNEENPYSLSINADENHSLAKRVTTTTNHVQSNFSCVNDSPRSSNGSDCSCSNNWCNSVVCHQLCRCPHVDCVIHDRRYCLNVPIELTFDLNPTYGTTNLLLHYAHLERCRRHGLNIHQDKCSS